jgi:hypothetical protein
MRAVAEYVRAVPQVLALDDSVGRLGHGSFLPRDVGARRRTRIGHAIVSITLDTCSHAIPAMQEEAAALIAGLVFAGE